LAFEFSDGVLEDALGVSVAREPVFIAGLCAPKISIIQQMCYDALRESEIYLFGKYEISELRGQLMSDVEADFASRK
jgi:hypothetical protein